MTYRLQRPDAAARQTYRAQLCAEGSPVRVSGIGHTLLGHPIDMFSIGTGARSLLYVGAHHGTEWLCSSLLYRFLFSLAEAAMTGEVRCGMQAQVLLSAEKKPLL